VLLDRLARSSPRLHDALHAVFHAIGAGLLGVILWASWTPLVESVRIQEYVGAIGDFQAPVWPIRLITLIGLAVTALVYLMLMIHDLQRLRGRGEGART
jgi:TRAP-type mannitol/chloroaromatic compound transport system permease small subunit